MIQLIRDKAPLFFDKRQSAVQTELIFLIQRLEREPRAARLAAIKLSCVNPAKLGSGLRLALRAPCLAPQDCLAEFLEECARCAFGQLDTASKWRRALQAQISKDAFPEGSFGALLALSAREADATLNQELGWRIAASGCSER